MQTRQVIVLVIVVTIITLALGTVLGSSVTSRQTYNSATTQIQTVTTTVYYPTATSINYSSTNSSVLKEIIVQPVETEISQNVSCGANLGSVCSTEPTVGCVDVSYGTTTETSYIFNDSTSATSPTVNSTTFTTTLSVSSESTEIITTEACTHL